MLFGNIDRAEDGTLRFAGHSVTELAAQYGTPLYLMDEQRIRDNCRTYIGAFREYFPSGSMPLYASKACCFAQLCRIAEEEGMGLDVVSSGELFTAMKAGFPPERIHFHGNVKTDEEIDYALSCRIGTFIVDNPDELEALQRRAEAAGMVQNILLRITPGIDPHTYVAVNTGTVDSKFGSAIETGQAEEIIRRAEELPNIHVTGLHCHVGSMVFDEDVFERTVEVMIAFLADTERRLGIKFEVLNLGGGYGVRYIKDGKKIDIPERIGEVAAKLKECCAKEGIPMPKIQMEPGRSIVADAGMTVYTVGSVKRLEGFKNFAAVDGGMTDNPRYVLYGSEYTVLHVTKDGHKARFDLVGRCCESGDIIQPKVMLPADTCRGDLIAVCVTGAYNYSMASNYNRVGRPPVVMLTKDGSYVAVKRESLFDLSRLDQ